MDSEMAKKTFELQNNVELIHSADEIYKYNRQQQQEIIARKPWIKEYVSCGIEIFISDPLTLEVGP